MIAPENWITFIDLQRGFTVAFDPAKHSPAQINATYKVLEYIADTHGWEEIHKISALTGGCDTVRS